MAKQGPKKPMAPIEEARWDAAWATLRAKYGSYYKIARILTEATGRPITNVAVFYWGKNKRIPPEWARVIAELSNGEIKLFHLCPWLDPRTVGIDL